MRGGGGGVDLYVGGSPVCDFAGLGIPYMCEDVVC